MHHRSPLAEREETGLKTEERVGSGDPMLKKCTGSKYLLLHHRFVYHV